MYTLGMALVKRGAASGCESASIGRALDLDGAPPEAELEVLAARVRESGHAIAHGLFDRDAIRALADTIEALLETCAVPFGPNAFLGHRTRRLFNLLARHPRLRAVAAQPATLGVVERLLDPECLLSSLTAIEIHPGEIRQPLHCDDGSHGLPRPGPIHGVVAIWALSDFTRKNGGTHLVPGSHRFDRIPRRGDDPETIQVEMEAGSVLFYDASLWHGGGANRSDAPRRAIVANYCAGYLRQEECQLLAIPREQVAEFSPRLRRLIGYGTYRGLLGHVDQQSPERLVDPRAPSAMVWDRIRRRDPGERSRE